MRHRTQGITADVDVDGGAPGVVRDHAVPEADGSRVPTATFVNEVSGVDDLAETAPGDLLHCCCQRTDDHPVALDGAELHDPRRPDVRRDPAGVKTDASGRLAHIE